MSNDSDCICLMVATLVMSAHVILAVAEVLLAMRM